MRVGVVVGLHKDTDLKEKFSELREMGMESCQLVCWDRTLLNEETAALVKQAVEEEKIDITAFWCGWEAGNARPGACGIPVPEAADADGGL